VQRIDWFWIISPDEWHCRILRRQSDSANNSQMVRIAIMIVIAVTSLTHAQLCSKCLYMWNRSKHTHFTKFRIYVRSEVFTAVTMKNSVLWDVEPCRPCVNRRFRGTYHLHFQGRKIRLRGTSVSRWLQHADFSTLKMEAIRSTDTSVHTRSTRCHIPEDGILQNIWLRYSFISYTGDLCNQHSHVRERYG
jgi:hypothetical protein